ncbi:MAG: Lrp/AsnC family transcriptional regulator [Nanoarchaeota archaeon]|nr:Lrp/AsnC family transcriptional regulator [Nanoarchaeota archaeon]MCG2718965.1 Lrp/AsnC family transcriptional regulator [Nanoarchaeota archaeon]
MIKKTDLIIISSLRQNAREKLTEMSRKTRIPVSTIFDRIKLHEGGLIKKHTALVDFGKLGYNTRANIILKVKREHREDVREFLMKHPSVNSAFKINNGYDFSIETVFQNIKEVEDFIELLEDKFSIKSKQVFYVIDELKKEAFLSNPALESFGN